MRKALIILVLASFVAVPALAQSPLLWSQECDGEVVVDGEYPPYVVECYASETTPEPTEEPTPTPDIGYPPPAPDRYIDHEDFKDFPVPPVGDKRSGSDLKVYWEHRSVGQMIDWGMNCIAAIGITPTYGETICRPFYDQGYVGLWTGDGFAAGDWLGKLNEWEQDVNARIEDHDVFMMKYCYLNGLTSAPDFSRVAETYLRLSRAHPDKTFVLWTMPLTNAYYAPIEAYNAAARGWDLPANVWLFDLADIESHRPDGSACTLNGHEVVCQEYLPTTALTGHITKSAGLRIAQYIWVMLHRMNIAGIPRG